jgi:cysteine-rich repeat protein
MCINITGCVAATLQLDAIVCVSCNSMLKLVLANGACDCMAGFQMINGTCS